MRELTICSQFEEVLSHFYGATIQKWQLEISFTLPATWWGKWIPDEANKKTAKTDLGFPLIVNRGNGYQYKHNTHEKNPQQEQGAFWFRMLSPSVRSGIGDKTSIN